MNQSSDQWFIRLPDDQVLAATSTTAVRVNIENGQIPLASRVRRSAQEPWVPLDQVEAFADLVPRPRNGSSSKSPGGREQHRPVRTSAMAIQKIGVRALVAELVNALDATFLRSKLTFACYTGLAIGSFLLLETLLFSLLAAPWGYLARGVTALVVLVLISRSVTLLTQATFLELSLLRPPRWPELSHHLGRNCWRLTITSLLLLTLLGGLLALVRWLPGWLTLEENGWPAELSEILAGSALLLQVALEVILLPLLAFALLLAPIVVVEESPIFRALGQWWSLVHLHLPRVVLYQTLAVAVSLLAAVPFLLPVELAAAYLSVPGRPALGAQALISLLRGLALTPAVAYLAVANVYIYLNLRYDQPPTR